MSSFHAANPVASTFEQSADQDNAASFDTDKDDQENGTSFDSSPRQTSSEPAWVLSQLGDADTASPTSVERKSPRVADREKMNKFLQKAVFGTAVEDSACDELAEEAKLKHQWFGLRHPDTPIRGAYDMFQLFIMLYLGWLLPTRLAFSKGATGVVEVIVDIFIDLSVWVDMFLNCYMYQYDEQTRKLITDVKYLKRKYLRSWFIVDFFSVVPLDQVLFAIGSWLVEGGESDDTVTWGYRLLEWSVAARLMRLLRLVRLGKLKKLLNIDSIVHNIYVVVRVLGVTKLQVAFYFRVFFLVCLILGGSHFLGCFWLYLGRHNVLGMQNPMGWMLVAYKQDTINKTKDFLSCIGGSFDMNDWNSRHGSSCKGYHCAPVPAGNPYDVDCTWIEDRMLIPGGSGDAHHTGASQETQYLTAFYFAIVTIATVGYGDIMPDTPGEKEFVIFCITLGAFVYAYIIGDFSLLITNLQREKSDFDAKMRQVNDYLGYIDASEETRMKVRDYYGERNHKSCMQALDCVKS